MLPRRLLDVTLAVVATTAMALVAAPVGATPSQLVVLFAVALAATAVGSLGRSGCRAIQPAGAASAAELRSAARAVAAHFSPLAASCRLRC